MIMSLARIAAWVGDKDLACQQLAVVIQLPSELSYGELKLQPWWDSAARRSVLRKNRRLARAEI